MAEATVHSNPEALKMEAILFLLLSAKSDEELAQARKDAARIKGMTGDEVKSLLGGRLGQPERNCADGPVLRFLRQP